jgi:hypothetical protein
MTIHTAEPGKKPVRGNQTLAKRVREALLSLGGEAHRAIVIEQIAKHMGHDTRQIPEDLSEAVILSFEQNWRDERRRATYGFHLPFGEGSHRWGVVREETFAH